MTAVAALREAPAAVVAGPSPELADELRRRGYAPQPYNPFDDNSRLNQHDAWKKVARDASTTITLRRFPGDLGWMAEIAFAAPGDTPDERTGFALTMFRPAMKTDAGMLRALDDIEQTFRRAYSGLGGGRNNR